MNAEYKKLWIEALRSGDYAQTQEVLKNQKGYCCLGVLQEVCALAGLTINEDDEAFLLDVNKAEDVLGLDKATQDSLATMNDNGKSFQQIADHIECEL